VVPQDVNRAYRVNPPLSSVGALRSFPRLRNIIVGALGSAIVACFMSIVRMRLHLLDKIRGNLWSGQLRHHW